MRVLAVMLFASVFLFAAPPPACARADAAPASVAVAETRLFAVEFRTGPARIAGKPPQEQLHFAAHSANLRRLREAGVLRIGARYGDKGLIVVEAASLPVARRLIDVDPSIAAGNFVYEIHEFSLFYDGTLSRPGGAK